MGVRTYRLTIEGELGDGSRHAFSHLAVARCRGTTILEGPVRDQTELHGLLQRVRDLGLTLIDVALVEGVEAGTAPQQGTDGSQPLRSHG